MKQKQVPLFSKKAKPEYNLQFAVLSSAIISKANDDSHDERFRVDVESFFNSEWYQNLLDYCRLAHRCYDTNGHTLRNIKNIRRS